MLSASQVRDRRGPASRGASKHPPSHPEDSEDRPVLRLCRPGPCPDGTLVDLSLQAGRTGKPEGGVRDFAVGARRGHGRAEEKKDKNCLLPLASKALVALPKSITSKSVQGITCNKKKKCQ